MTAVRHSRARRHARYRRAEGPVRLRHRLCDGRLRPAHPRLHAARHLGGPAPDPAAGRLAHHLDAGRRRRRRHPVRHAQRLLRPGPGADLDDPAVRGVHRPVRLRPGLLGPPGVPHHRGARPRRRVRHRHGAGGGSLAGQAARARLLLCRARLAGRRAVRGAADAAAAAVDRLARHVHRRAHPRRRRLRGALVCRRAEDLHRPRGEAAHRWRRSACW